MKVYVVFEDVIINGKTTTRVIGVYTSQNSANDAVFDTQHSDKICKFVRYSYSFKLKGYVKGFANRIISIRKQRDKRVMMVLKRFKHVENSNRGNK